MTPFPTPVTTGNGRSSHHTQESAYELFRNRDGDAFVDIYLQGHRETHPVSSKAFRHWLTLKDFDHAFHNQLLGRQNDYR